MRPFIRRTTTLGLLGAVAIASGMPAAAQSGRAESISHRQSILTELSATGEPGTSRVFTQVAATGDGTVTVELPQQSTSGLRSLDGFGGPDVEGDTVVHTLEPAGEDADRARTVADNTAELPVSVSVAYRLDGQEIDPDDLAGQDGSVEVEYTVRNLTAEPQDVISFDAENNRIVETMDVAVPMVGTLSILLPPEFANIDAPGAVTAGDGRGNTVVNFSLLLFEPLGSEEQVVSWTADTVDTAIPETSVQVLPVDDQSFGSLNATADAYKGATESLTTLANGALIINSNLLLLASGAGDLLDGLGQLSDGASALNDGLANTAAPGAQQLSDGLSQARAGGGELATGLGTLAAGATQLADGQQAALAGAGELSSGLGQLADGAAQVAAGNRDAAAGGAQLSAGLGQLATGAVALADGLDSAETGAVTLSTGLGALALGATRLSVGLTDARTGADQLSGGLGDLADGAVTLSVGLNSASDGAAELAAGLNERAAPGAVQIRDGLAGLLDALGGESDTPADQTLIGGLNGLVVGTEGLLAGLKPDDDPATSTLGDGTGALALLTAGLLESFGPDENGLDAGERAQAGADALGSAQNLLNAIRGSGAAPGSFDYAAVSGDFVCLSADCSVNATVEEILATGKPAAGIPPGGVIDAILGSVQTGLQGNADDLGDLPASCEAAVQQVLTNPDPDGLAVILAARCIAQSVDDGLNGEVIPGIEGELLPGLRLVRGGTSNPAALDPANPGYNPTCLGEPEDGFQPCGVKQVLQLLSGGATELAAGLGDAADGSTELAAGLGQLAAGGEQISAGADAAEAGSTALVVGLRQLEDGGQQLSAGALAARDGSQALVAGLGQLSDGADQIADGNRDAAAGSRELVSGLNQLADGADQVADGNRTAFVGSQSLVDGLQQLADGGAQLAPGARLAAEGAGELSDGLVQLDDGAAQLAAGLGDAADGSGQIADGLDAAEEGGGRLADGTVALQEGFEEQLIGGVSAGRQGASQDYEQVRAVIARGREGAAPYGVAVGADQATTVFQFDLAGVGNEEGPSTGLLAGLAILALAAVGGLGFALRRTMG
jgi:putative membrane protein